jgi:hypothetical protein
VVSEALGAQLGYLAVLIGTLLEGEAVLFLAGLAAQHDYLSLPVVVVVAAFGGFLSDQFLFFLGRRYGNRLLARFPSVGARAPRVHALIQRWDILQGVHYGLEELDRAIVGVRLGFLQRWYRCRQRGARASTGALNRRYKRLDRAAINYSSRP